MIIIFNIVESCFELKSQNSKKMDEIVHRKTRTETVIQIIHGTVCLNKQNRLAII